MVYSCPCHILLEIKTLAMLCFCVYLPPPICPLMWKRMQKSALSNAKHQDFVKKKVPLLVVGIGEKQSPFELWRSSCDLD